MKILETHVRITKIMKNQRNQCDDYENYENQRNQCDNFLKNENQRHL